MRVNQDPNSSKYKIQSYNTSEGQRHIIINDTTYTHSILLYNDELLPWRPTTFEDIQAQDFDLILNTPPPIFLLGTGPSLVIPSMDLLRPLFEKGIGVEFMSTQAALRTYVVLSSEDRKVAMALII